MMVASKISLQDGGEVLMILEYLMKVVLKGDLKEANSLDC